MPKLSVDAILAALTVVSVAGCERAAPSASKEPPPVASTAAVASAAAVAPAVTATAAPAVESATPLAAKPAVSATEQKPGAPSKAVKGNAACGAGTCSADMKK